MFDEIRLPIDVERGAVGGPKFKTTILELASGFEQRNIDWSQTRGEWDISYGLMQMSDNQLDTNVHAVRDFFFCRRGRAVGFRFRDWSDYEIGKPDTPTADNQSIGVGDNVITLFQVFKRYTSGSVTYDRVIKKLNQDAGRVIVLLDNVVQVSGFTVDLNLGTITFSSPPAGGVIVQVALEYEVPVRFDRDHLRITVQTFLSGDVPAIPLIELRRKPGIP